MTAAAEPSEMRHALADLHRRRRVQRLHHLDWIDTLYRAYVVGLGLFGVLILLAFVVGDHRLASGTVADVAARGPGVVGVVTALLVAFGLRSGAHGGPLALEPPDVQHVLLAPVDRGTVLRSAALRQARGVLAIGAVAGAMVGALAGPRFSAHGGDIVSWVLACGAFGVLAATAAWGSALVASSMRLTQGVALVVGSVLVLWSIGDLVAESATSPLTMLGSLALVPVASSTLAGVGAAAVLLLVGFGFVNLGRASLEPMLHRAQLVRALRFAATVQDLRAVITLRRQLSSERARTRPWFRLPPSAPTGRAMWRRDWHGVLRWPGARVGRVAVLALVTGVACAGAVRGTTPLLLVGPIAAYVVSLDVVEGLAQDVDHPDRSSDGPVATGRRYLAHLAVPYVLMAAAGLLAFAAGMLTAALIPAGHAPSVPASVAMAAVVSVTLLGPTAAALSVHLGRPERDLTMLIVHPGVVAAQQFGPVVVLAIAFVPLLIASAEGRRGDPTGIAILVTGAAVAVALAMRSFLGSRRSDTA